MSFSLCDLKTKGNPQSRRAKHEFEISLPIVNHRIKNSLELVQHKMKSGSTVNFVQQVWSVGVHVQVREREGERESERERNLIHLLYLNKSCKRNLLITLFKLMVNKYQKYKVNNDFIVKAFHARWRTPWRALLDEPNGSVNKLKCI